MLDIILGATVDKFEAGMHKAGGALEGLTHKVHQLGSGKLDSLFAGFAGGAAVAGIFEAAKATFHLAEAWLEMPVHQIEKMFAGMKMAERLGVTGEEMKALKLAAAETGTEFDALVRPMERLGAMVGDAALKGGDAAKTFSDLKLNFADLGKMSRMEQFQAIAKALGEIDNTYSREDLARKLFGRGFGEIKLALKEVAGHLDELKEKGAHLFGTKTPEQVRDIKEAKLAVEEMGFAWESVKNSIATGLAPEIKGLAHSFAEILVTIRQVSELWHKTGGVASTAVSAIATGNILGEQESWWTPTGMAKRFWGMFGVGPGVKGATEEDEKKMEGMGGLLAEAGVMPTSRGAEAGSKEAFEIIAQARMGNPVVEKLNEIQQTIEFTMEAMHEAIKEVATNTAEMAETEGAIG